MSKVNLIVSYRKDLVYNICSRVMGGFEFIDVHVAWEMFYLYGDIEMGVKQEDIQGPGSVILEAS